MIRMMLSLLLFVALTVSYPVLKLIDYVARRMYFLALTFQEALLHYCSIRK